MTDEQFLEERNNTIVEWKQLIYDGEYQNYDISNIGQIRNHETKQLYKLSKVKGMKNCYEFIQIKLNSGKKLNIGIHRLMGMMFIPIPIKYLQKNINIKKLVIDHIDEVKYHNVLSNLQWLTQEENINKSLKDNINIRSLDIRKKEVKKICEDLMNGLTIYDVSRKYNYSEKSIYEIRYGYIYKDISKNYDFPTIRIDDSTVIQICEMLMKNKTYEEISNDVGVSYGTIAKISTGKAWSYITSKYNFPNRKSMNDEKKKLIIKICEMLQDGKGPVEISKILDVSTSYISHIAMREVHTDISKDYTFNYKKFKLSDETIHNICKDLASKEYTNKEVSERNNVSLSFVKDIKYRRSRTDISENYEW